MHSNLKTIKNKYSLSTKLLYVTQNCARYKQVIKAAAAFVHETLVEGGIKRLPYGSPDKMTVAFINLERSLEDLK